MKITKVINILFFMCIVAANVFAQNEEKPKVLKYLVSELSYKGAFPIQGEQLQSLDLYFGYKFKNKLSIGMSSATSTILNFDENTFIYYIPIGLGIRYLMYEKKTNGASLGIEPFANFTSATAYRIDEPGYDYLAYEAGVNFVDARFPYMFVGVGVGQLLFTNSDKEMLNINLSFGIRL